MRALIVVAVVLAVAIVAVVVVLAARRTASDGPDARLRQPRSPDMDPDDFPAPGEGSPRLPDGRPVPGSAADRRRKGSA